MSVANSSGQLNESPPKRPTLAIPVADLAASIAFYVDRIGFTLADHQPAADLAQILDSDGDLLLLAGPRAGDLTPHLDTTHRILRPGGRVGFHGGDLDARRGDLAGRGVETQLVETSWGEYTLTAHDPDGYSLVFRTLAHRTREETLALYTKAPDDLENALAGLSEQDLDLARAPGEWTIRQIVHHMADGDGLFLLPMKMALVESGRTYAHNWPGGNAPWGEAYAGLPIGPALALFRAIRVHVAQIEQGWPNSWDRYILGATERQETFGSFMDTATNHALEHIDEIRAIRRVHGR